jgi:hypothetical protein
MAAWQSAAAWRNGVMKRGGNISQRNEMWRGGNGGGE